MKKFLNIALAAAALIACGSCSKESLWTEHEDAATGKLATSGMLVQLSDEENIINRRPTRADVNVDNFTIDIIRDGETTPRESFRYDRMPEVVTLPVGSYRAVASYGDNKDAAFDEPYYRGESAFTIVADRITADIEPISCRLSNVRVTVLFGKDLQANMSPDSHVNVVVGERGSLNFNPSTAGSGYFAYVEESQSLVAMFNGTVEGFPVSMTKTFDNVAPGNHYKITFLLITPDDDDKGAVAGDIKVDATIEVVDKTIDIEPDDQHPDQTKPNDYPDDDEPAPPVPGPAGDGPAIIAEAPIDLGKVNDVDGSSHVVLNIHSDTGITGFKVYIESANLAGLVPEYFDLVNPGEFEETLAGLGLPYGAAVTNQKDVTFDISGFMVMLGATGPGDHTFRLEVTDAAGSSEASLRLRTK